MYRGRLGELLAGRWVPESNLPVTPARDSVLPSGEKATAASSPRLSASIGLPRFARLSTSQRTTWPWPALAAIVCPSGLKMWLGLTLDLERPELLAGGDVPHLDLMVMVPVLGRFPPPGGGRRGLKATSATEPAPDCSGAPDGRRVATSHRRTVPSSFPAEARTRPSALLAIPWTRPLWAPVTRWPRVTPSRFQTATSVGEYESRPEPSPVNSCALASAPGWAISGPPIRCPPATSHNSRPVLSSAPLSQHRRRPGCRPGYGRTARARRAARPRCFLVRVSQKQDAAVHGSSCHSRSRPD